MRRHSDTLSVELERSRARAHARRRRADGVRIGGVIVFEVRDTPSLCESCPVILGRHALDWDRHDRFRSTSART
jgi:hypothetical protein